MSIAGKIGSALLFPFKAVGKAGFGLGKGAVKGAAFGAEGLGKGVGKFGQGVISHALSNPLGTAAFVGGSAFVGYQLADMENGDRAGTAGKAALGAVAASAIPGMTTVGAAAAGGLAGAGMMAVGATYRLGQAMIKTPKEITKFSDMGKIELTKTGGALLTLGAVTEGMIGAARKWESIRMGKSDGMMHTQTPTLPQVQDTPSYQNNGGATGDLVFAMYNNRL